MSRVKTCIIMVLVLLMTGMTPVWAKENTDVENAEPQDYETITIPVLTEGNYFIEWTSEDGAVARVEITDPTNDAPMQDMSCMPLILGDEEFAPGSYTRKLEFKCTVINITFRMVWNVNFTIYSTKMPKITSITGWKQEYFATYSEAKIERSTATTSTSAFAYSSGRDVIRKPDGKATFVDMQFYLYHDDSAKIRINWLRN